MSRGCGTGSEGYKASPKSLVWRATSSLRGNSSRSSINASVETGPSRDRSNLRVCVRVSSPAPSATDSTKSYCIPSASGIGKLLEEVLLAAVGLSALLGGALLWLSRAKRRRGMLEARLKAIVMGVSSSDAPVVSLRRLPSRRKLLPSLSTTLDFPYTVTGGRVGPLHLVVIGMSAAATTGLVVWLAGFGP